jgi:radical SAM superfamily enzyme YgiQ (UPF0313 family)
MKLLLINPSKYDANGELMKFKYGSFPPITLCTLASLIKNYKQVKVKIIDEFIEEIPFEENYDLVGITTAFTCTFPRVIDISNEFRKKGVPVVLGGTHSTCTWKDSIKYADSIVVGEAEYTFPRLIEDFLTKRRLEKIYANKTFIDLENIPAVIPRYDLIDLNKYFKVGIINKTNYFQIETSRGCPMKCTFCTVRITHGLKPRFKTISSVINEIRFLKKKYNATFFSFTDDNFLININRSKEILKQLSKENIKFFCETSARIIDTPELIPLLKKAGCIIALVGIESINLDSLKSAKKTHNKVDEYKNIFLLFNKYKIPFFPSFMFGFDFDNENIFLDVYKFLKTVNVQRVVFSILTPFPGTELYEQFQKEGRIFTDNFSLYDICHVVYQPKRLSINQLQNEFWKLYLKYYSIKEITSRLLKAKKGEFLYSLFTNLRFRNFVYKKIYPYNSGIKRLH